MLLIECVNAYMATAYLMEKEWDYETAYALVCLKKALQSHADFYLAEEQKLVRLYGAKDDSGQVIINERGNFNFCDPLDAPKYNEKRMELGQVPVEINWAVRSVKKPEFIKPAHLEALDGFIEFGGGAG